MEKMKKMEIGDWRLEIGGLMRGRKEGIRVNRGGGG